MTSVGISAEMISIHALRGEGDKGIVTIHIHPPISIHALRGEGDDNPRVLRRHCPQFLSTPSVGRATCLVRGLRQSLPGFLSTPSVGRATRFRAR